MFGEDSRMGEARGVRWLAFRMMLAIFGAVLVTAIIYTLAERERAARLDQLRQTNRQLILRKRLGRTNVERRNWQTASDTGDPTYETEATKLRGGWLQLREREVAQLASNVKLMTGDMTDRLQEVRKRLIAHRYTMDEIDDLVTNLAAEERERQAKRRERSYANMTAFFLRLEERRSERLLPTRTALTEAKRALAELLLFTAKRAERDDTPRDDDDHTRRKRNVNDSGSCDYMNYFKTRLGDWNVKYCD